MNLRTNGPWPFHLLTNQQLQIPSMRRILSFREDLPTGSRKVNCLSWNRDRTADSCCVTTSVSASFFFLNAPPSPCSKKFQIKFFITLNGNLTGVVQLFNRLGIELWDQYNELNFNLQLPKIYSLIQRWNCRILTPIGKVTVAKTLILPKLNHLFISLPTPNLIFIYFSNFCGSQNVTRWKDKLLLKTFWREV